jgi:hypothetical protein
MYSNSQGTNWKGLDPINGTAVGSLPLQQIRRGL